MKGHCKVATDPAGIHHRVDDFGSILCKTAYGDRGDPCGWEIDHIVSPQIGGTDALSNLRPLHFRTNASLGGILGGFLSKV